MARGTITVRSGGRDYTVDVEGDRVRVEGEDLSVSALGGHEFRVGGSLSPTAWAIGSGDTRWVFLDGRTYALEVAHQNAGRRKARAHHGSLTAPMPATVRRVNVAAGDRVKSGDVLIILEAMKMELPIKAGGAGTVRSVLCREGELVQPGAELIEIDALDTP